MRRRPSTGRSMPTRQGLPAAVVPLARTLHRFPPGSANTLATRSWPRDRHRTPGQLRSIDLGATGLLRIAPADGRGLHVLVADAFPNPLDGRVIRNIVGYRYCGPNPQTSTNGPTVIRRTLSRGADPRCAIDTSSRPRDAGAQPRSCRLLNSDSSDRGSRWTSPD